MASTISTPFDALIHEVLDKVQYTLGLSYDAKSMAIIRIPAAPNFFAALEFYTTETSDDVRVHVYLQQGYDDLSSKLTLEKQGQFYCSQYSVLYPQYGSTTNVFSYVRTINSSLIMDEILLLPTACSSGLEFLTAENGQYLLLDNGDSISVNQVYTNLFTESGLILTTESNQPFNLEV